MYATCCNFYTCTREPTHNNGCDPVPWKLDTPAPDVRLEGVWFGF